MINTDPGYVFLPEKSQIIEGIAEIIRVANEENWLTVVVTNQSGIGRGLFTEDDFWSFMAWITKELSLRSASLDAVYFCPHNPADALARACSCRKPKPGLFLDAAQDLGLELAKSVAIGDKETDLEASRRAGVGASFLVSPEQVSASGFAIGSKRIEEIIKVIRDGGSL